MFAPRVELGTSSASQPESQQASRWEGFGRGLPGARRWPGTALSSNPSGEAGAFHHLPAQGLRGREQGCPTATLRPRSGFFVAPIRVRTHPAPPCVPRCENRSPASKSHSDEQAQIWDKLFDQGAAPSTAHQVVPYHLS